MPIPPARLVPALAMIRLFMIRTASFWLSVSGRGQIGATDPDGPVRTAVVLDHVVRDLQVAGVGVREDRTTLGDQAARLARRVAADLGQVAGEAHLVAAPDVEAVDRRGGGRAVAGRECVPAATRQEQGDNGPVVDRLVAGPGQAVDQRVPVGRDRSVAPERTAVEDRARDLAVGAARTDALELHPLADDEVLVVRAARIDARVRGRVVRVDDDERSGGCRIEGPLDGVVRRGGQRVCRHEPAAAVLLAERGSCRCFAGRPRTAVGCTTHRSCGMPAR